MTSPKQAIDRGDQGRYYTIPGFEDNTFISVTNVIGATEAKPFLIPWAAKLALETGNVKQSEVVRDAASERGTRFHDWAEQWGLGNQPDTPVDLEDECAGFLKLVAEEGLVPEAVETTVFSPSLGYAGTLDAILLTRDYGTLTVDYKTSKSLYKSTALQLVALRNAEYLLLPDGTYIDNPTTDGAAAIHVTKRGSKLVPARSGDVQWEAFKAALHLAKYYHNDAKMAFRKETPSAS